MLSDGLAHAGLGWFELGLAGFGWTTHLWGIGDGKIWERLKTSVITLLSGFQLNDAFEEVDEQRQVVAQWKRKSQKIQVFSFVLWISIEMRREAMLNDLVRHCSMIW